MKKDELNYFEVKLKNNISNKCLLAVGICTSETYKTNKQITLLGDDEESWGFYLVI